MIYFDNAATGFPKDRLVISAMSRAMATCGNPGRSGHKYSLSASEILYSTREELANLFGTTPEKVVLCPSATYALNIAIKGLFCNSGKILISDLEHNSVIRPSFASGVVEHFAVDIDNDEKTIENFEEKIPDNVSLVVISHASNVCGRILPIEKIATICSKYEIPIILDASQTAGYLNFNFNKMPIDIVCIPGHKGFYGPMGTGALIINPNKNLSFKTIIQGGTGILSTETEMPTELPERLEVGTIGVQNFAGLTVALKMCKINNIENNENLLFLIEELNKIHTVKIYGFSESNKEKYLPIILFNCTDIASHTLSDLLSQKNICVRSGFHCAPMAHQKFHTGRYGAVRISLGKRNTLNECEKFIRVIKEIVKK